MPNNKTTVGSRVVRAAAILFAAVVLAAGWPVHAAQGAPGGSITLVSVDEAYRKLSPDLRDALTAPSMPDTNWVRDTSGGRLVKLLVLSQDATDSDLKGLRAAIVDAGGSVYYRFSSVNGLLAMLPAANVVAVARRSDVEVMSPNRPTTRTRSLVESITGAGAARALGPLPAGYDGTGVGIAVLDSGVMGTHKSLANAAGASRVRTNVNMRKLSETISTFWDAGKDYGDSLAPGSAGRKYLENLVNASGSAFVDPFGHGTIVASIAAGRAVPGLEDTTGVAPGAAIFDVRVLNESGLGEVADALAGLDWVLYHAKEYNIRVVNISFAADSTTSYLLDPLCRAVRNTVAAGVTVVVAAGNFGLLSGQETYGTISSPGDEPSAITVGSVNPHDTAARLDDTLNNFSSRGPTRGAWIDAANVRHADNLLKPDLVAPGNHILGALSTGNSGSPLNAIALAFPSLVYQLPTSPGTGLMYLSGTSIAAPVVSGTVALMLQANPGLTPPLVKAIMQYTAQPLAQDNLVQQGAGQVNALGTVQLAAALIPDIAARVAKTKLKAGDSILAAGRSLPAPASTFEGATIPWSRFAFMGGARVLAGNDLFAKFQPIYDPTLTWVGQRVRQVAVDYYDKDDTYVSGFIEGETKGKTLTLVTSGVVDVTPKLGLSSLLQHTGMFTPSQRIPDDLPQGSAAPLATGIVVSGGVVTADSVVLAESIILAESVILAESIILAEGVLYSESVILSESGPLQAHQGGAVFTGEP